ncbi:MAG: glycosyltransferase [Candidatus Nanopelagicales bacterium]|nr:MAG: glycosyltransferase [Actinomycetota bacterium]
MSFTADTISGVDPFASHLRVLHVLQPGEAGVWRYASDMAGFEAAQGWDVHVASPVRPDADVPWREWQAVRNPAKGVRDESRRLLGIVEELRPDVVVAHSSKAGLVVRSALRGSLPTVFLPHAWSFAALTGPVALAARRWEKLAAQWTSAVVCVGEGEARTGVAAGIRAPFFLVPNPVPPQWASDARRPFSELGIGSAPDVVFVGRLSEQKGVDHLLAAWGVVRRLRPDATLVIVGDGPDRADLEASAGPGVRFVGAVTDPWSYVEAAPVAVLPSRWEGLSLSMLEAMASGRSMVVTDVDGSEVVRAAGGGAVVPVGDTTALARELLTRLDEPDLVAQEGRSAQEYVRVHHDFEVAARRLAAIVSRAYAFGDPASS